MRNIIQYPITQEEKTHFIEQMNEGVGSIEPLLLSMLAIEFATWMWAVAISYMRHDCYTVSKISGLDINRTYSVNELYTYWLKTEWLKDV